MTARHSPLFTLESGQSGLRIYTSQRDAAKELQRKEKAMAEMAALLVLRKKWEAFCSEDAEG